MRLILSAAAVTLLSGPALAQNNPNQDRHDDQHQRPNNAAPARSYVPPARGPAQGSAPAYRPLQSNSSAPQGYAPQNRPPMTQGAPTYRPPANDSGQYHTNRAYPGAPAGQYQGYRQGQSQGYRQGQYRGYGDTRNEGQWRNRSGDWWRGQRGWGGYEGRRFGYWFAPGWGYYSVDPRWYGYDWEVGAIVPYQFRSYYVSDPYEYGLPPAPYGAAWIFLGDRIVLVDLGSGQILDMAYGY